MLPSAPSGGEGIPLSAPLAGLPLWRRIVLAAERAGFGRILVKHPDCEQPASLAGTAASPLSPAACGADDARRVVFLAGNVVPTTEWLRRIRTMPLPAEHLYIDGASVAVAVARDCRELLRLATAAATMAELVTALRALLKTVDGDIDRDGRVVLAAAGDVRAAERWLLRGLVKPNEGLMSRLLERRISLAVTRRLCRTSVTPNAVTLVSLGVGLLGALFFLSSSALFQVTGALLFLTHSILDGCDGELARLKFLESRRGALLDVVGDNLVHAVVFSSMAIGWSVAVGAAWPLLIGAVAVASTTGSAVVVYRRGMRASTDADRSSTVARLADGLAYRDFIYVIVVLAALGRAHWFIGVTALGAPAFLLMLAWLGRRADPRRSPAALAR
jgi:phosphatidylglycerophosphate synthase